MQPEKEVSIVLQPGETLSGVAHFYGLASGKGFKLCWDNGAIERWLVDRPGLSGVSNLCDHSNANAPDGGSALLDPVFVKVPNVGNSARTLTIAGVKWEPLTLCPLREAHTPDGYSWYIRAEPIPGGEHCLLAVTVCRS